MIVTNQLTTICTNTCSKHEHNNITVSETNICNSLPKDIHKSQSGASVKNQLSVNYCYLNQL